jgi:hypothetical protein
VREVTAEDVEFYGDIRDPPTNAPGTWCSPERMTWNWPSEGLRIGA